MFVTILMPCLNEEETLSACIEAALTWLHKSAYEGEVLVADNGSTDNSRAIALSKSARVINVEEKGYGSALYHGCLAANGEYIVMADCDQSYDFSALDPFLEKLEAGYDLVVGNRFLGGIAPGAMPWKNRYIGNPFLTRLGKFLFNSKLGDFHCGIRAFTKRSFQQMELRTTGMEFASEMIIRATLDNLKIAEVPTTLSPDGRSRPPHLRPWKDGWRHMRFMLLYSPNWLLLYPGSITLFSSALVYLLLLIGPLKIGSAFSMTCINILGNDSI